MANTMDLAQFKARTEQLAAIYHANPVQFANERMAIDRAQAALDEAKQASATKVARREQHTRMIRDAHSAGALTDRERDKILERYLSEYASRDLDEAQLALDGAWASFWNALKKAERREAQIDEIGKQARA